MNNEFDENVSLDNRSYLQLSGVVDVGQFDDRQILIKMKNSKLIIKGEGLHIEGISLETKTAVIKGKINSLTYNDTISSNSVFKRLFGG